jgi:hypothetical protein
MFYSLEIVILDLRHGSRAACQQAGGPEINTQYHQKGKRRKEREKEGEKGKERRKERINFRAGDVA